MKSKRSMFLGALALLLLLAACGESAVPQSDSVDEAELPTPDLIETPEVVIELVKPSPEGTSPSEFVPEATEEAELVEPTAVLAEPAATATPESDLPTSTPEPVQLTIVEPVDAVQILTGSTLAVQGVVDPETAVSVTVNLQMGPYTLVQTVTEVDADTGAWAVDLIIPHSVNGNGRLLAMTEVETAVHDIQLVHDTTADDTDVAIKFSRPVDGQIAVAGHPLFFEGSVSSAINNTITIGLYDNDCTTFAARQSFSLSSANASWNGIVNLPATLNGRTCAFAYTGSPETGLWREELLWLPWLPPEDETIVGSITLGNASNVPFKAGEQVYLFGSAIDAAGAELQLNWMAEDGETLLVSETAVVDALGYWETELLLPLDSVGPSTLTIQLGEGEEATILQQDLLIES